MEDWQASKNEDREWILIQHRTGREEGPFEENGWQGYKDGFGSEEGNYWIGLERLHDITSEGSWELYISVRYNPNGVAFLTCNNFRVESEWEHYGLIIDSCDNLRSTSSFYMDLPKAFEALNTALFTTKDKDNDKLDVYNCAVAKRGGFWYNHEESCMRYFPPTGNLWHEAKMAIRPA